MNPGMSQNPPAGIPSGGFFIVEIRYSPPLLQSCNPAGPMDHLGEKSFARSISYVAMPRHAVCLSSFIDINEFTNQEKERLNGALDPADRRRPHCGHQPRLPRWRATANAQDLFHAERAESEGGAPVGALLLHHGGGMLLPAGRGDPAVADGEGNARREGARHTGGPGPGGGRGARPAEEEASLAGVPVAPNRLEKVLPGDVPSAGKSAGPARRLKPISPFASLRRNRILQPMKFPTQ